MRSGIDADIEEYRRFQIPMRGNEIDKAYDNANDPTEFQIPMRGNEQCNVFDCPLVHASFKSP